MKIYLDFDGTVVEHQYPSIGKHNDGCIEVIKKLKAAGHEIILNTYRADCNDGTLAKAIVYLESIFGNDIIASVEQKKIDPHPWDWKYFMDNDLIFIDDISDKVPLIPSLTAAYDKVDWKTLDIEFKAKGIY